MRKKWYITLSFMERDDGNPSKPPICHRSVMVYREMTFEAVRLRYEAALTLLRNAGFVLWKKGDES